MHERVQSKHILTNGLSFRKWSSIDYASEMKEIYLVTVIPQVFIVLISE